jgi:hypothetical protein
MPLGGFRSSYMDVVVADAWEVLAWLDEREDRGARCYPTGSDHVVEENRRWEKFLETGWSGSGMMKKSSFWRGGGTVIRKRGDEKSFSGRVKFVRYNLKCRTVAAFVNCYHIDMKKSHEICRYIYNFQASSTCKAPMVTGLSLSDRKLHTDLWRPPQHCFSLYKNILNSTVQYFSKARYDTISENLLFLQSSDLSGASASQFERLPRW